MDPNENLAEQRRLSAQIDKSEDQDELVDLGEQLCWLVDAMDGWLSKGGALPEAWKR